MKPITIIFINFFFLLQYLLACSGCPLLHLCNHVKYVTFDINLCTGHKVTTAKLPDCCWSFWSLTMLGLLFCECPDFPLDFPNSSCGSVVNLILRFGKIMSRTIFCILSIYIYSISLTPATCILSLVVFQIWCHSLTKNVPLWLPTILILLANDIHLNPGPHFKITLFFLISCHGI